MRCTPLEGRSLVQKRIGAGGKVGVAAGRDTRTVERSSRRRMHCVVVRVG